VAAGTHDRLAQGSATLGNGATHVGASLATAVPSKPLIAASAAGLPGANPEQARLCFAAVDNGGAAVLDPAKVTGKIVVCDRGVTARPNKSRAVAEAGGVGMILVNTSPNSLNADLHFVPSVHLPDTDRAAILAYAATAGPTASISAASIINDPQAPSTAAFSSRGPLQAAGGDLLKPDLIAPGVDILAGVAPPGNGGRLFDLLSGTSMASPHVAGIAALLKEAKPGWSPMAIKSALMTTAGDVLDGGAPNTNPTLIFRQGAGHVQPEKALKPGLVFDSAFTDWVAFICGVQPGGGCAGVTPIDASNLNVASIAIADLVGIQKVTRRVTNVGNTAATYTASVDGLSGFSVSLSPAPISIAPGETKSFELQFLRLGAAFGAYTGGQLRLTSDAGDVVRIPVVLRPSALAAPAQVTGNGGPFSYAVKFGYDGPFTATARGLVPPSVTADNVADDPTDGSCSLTSPNAKLIPVVIPVGVTYARFSLFAADAAPGADLDLCVFSAGQTLLASSRNAGAAEEVNLINPSAGTYIVVVHGYAVASTSPFKLHTWLLGSADAGNMTVSAPAAAVTGQTGNISLGFSVLAGGTKYLASISYGGNSGLSSIGPTIVRVDTP
jgi:hypothetical protein